MELSSSITEVKGIGEKTAQLYGKLGIISVKDLIEYYPREYEKFDEPGLVNSGEFGKINTIYARLCSIPKLHLANGIKVISGEWTDVRGNRFESIWFNQPYLCKSLHTGDAYVLRGNKIFKNNRCQMLQPQLFSEKQYREMQKSLMPIYSLTAGITRQAIIKNVKLCLEMIGTKIVSDLDEKDEIKKKYMSLSNALRSIHFPAKRDMAEKARKRIALEELYLFFKKIDIQVSERANKTTSALLASQRETERLLLQLPFTLTKGQEEAWLDIRKELCSQIPMHRLIQGDVGSGKTVLAFLASVETCLNGHQAVLMAPTAVLATQHYNNFLKMFPSLKEETVLLTGALKAKEKREVYEKISNREAKIIIGTHAVFQEKVVFDSLLLVITDEQHRFGVLQRHELAEKGNEPHVLYMSATPIPRSLAGILYADLDLTVLSEKPKGRQKIHTCVINEKDRKKAYRFIAGELLKGHQAYVICPYVEESELLSGANVIETATLLKKEFINYNIGIMHGRMKQAEKDIIMNEFSLNMCQILVSTTVIEVGVDVPNSTVIMIENAEKFGLAQLHQLRGRVGRGDSESYCILMNGCDSEENNKRLTIMNESDDGFEISNKDFKMRGPGDVLGIRQSGDMEFKAADIYEDAEEMTLARQFL